MKIHAIHSVRHFGGERYHVPTCKNVRREAGRDDIDSPYIFEANSVREIAEEYWQDHIDEGSTTVEEAIGYVYDGLCGCVKFENDVSTGRKHPNVRHGLPAQRIAYDHRVDGLTPTQIAKQMGLPASTVRSMIRREALAQSEAKRKEAR